ncbi:MAG: hypothetical protein VKL39_20405 [Leptolyngbyaceae bacterium]|nr:hypothetical protein [Leptolyngbyaceae bacterium]
MSPSADHFRTANYRARKVEYDRWHRYQSKIQILRSQLGFYEAKEARPAACKGCTHYHGIAYGQNRDTRTVLVCGFHPYGWQGESSCPDWQSVESVDSLSP